MKDFPRGRGKGKGGDWDSREGYLDPWSGVHDGVGWGGWLLMALVLLLVVGLAVAVTMMLLRSGGLRSGGGVFGGGSRGTPATPASAVLDERYARGEIDEDEYLHRRAVLSGAGQH